MATEKRLIDLDKLVSEFMRRKVIEAFPDWESMSEASHAAVIRFARIYREIILKAPRVDAAPVVHGRWEPHFEVFDDDPSVGAVGGRYQTGWQCSVCGRYEYGKEPYCNCGAKMDKNEKP